MSTLEITRQPRLWADKFTPTAEDFTTFGKYVLIDPSLLLKPADIPDNRIGTNPSGIWTDPTTNREFFYVRDEPDQADDTKSHLGHQFARAYFIDSNHGTPVLCPFYDAQPIPGEDPSVSIINRRLPVSGRIESVFLVSTVNAQPKPHLPFEVGALNTDFWIGKNPRKMELIAKGPPGEKDIRVAQGEDPYGTELFRWGRPQPQSYSGNISFSKVRSPEQLDASIMPVARSIDPDLLPTGSGLWGGGNDTFVPGRDRSKRVIVAHEAYCTDEHGNFVRAAPDEDYPGRVYNTVFYGHDTRSGRIVRLGIVASEAMFPAGEVKQNAKVNLGKVVFPGGLDHGCPKALTAGVRDGRIGYGRLKRII